MLEFVLPFLNANISRFTNPFSIILGSLESPCSGLYRRKKSSPIESLDPEIFTFKVEALWKAFDLQPVIVERCNTARWNRLIETNRMVVVSSFYFASIYTARHPSTSCEASSCQYPIISIGQPLNRVLNSSGNSTTIEDIPHRAILG
ncbi:unnamed protein product [Rhizophagus irregularis]|nr:unnamed protein product [Rhizophagus irregularis]